jgi:RNA polymerase primary sigma factor
MTEKEIRSAILAAMDEAAVHAQDDFKQLPEAVKKQIADWVVKWYWKAGYKRLGRTLVAHDVESTKYQQLEIFAKKQYKKKHKNITKHDMLKCYLKEIRKYSLLNKDEELELARKIRERNDEDAKQRLVCSNLKFVVRIARRYGNRGLDLVELIDAGNLGLMHAADKFDDRKGFRFNTYSIWWIKRAIHEALETRVPLVRISDLARHIRQTNVKFVKKHGRKPTEEELSQILNEDLHSISLAISELRPASSIEELAKYREDLMEVVEKKAESDEDCYIDPFLYDFGGFDDLIVDPPDEIIVKQEEVKRFWTAFDDLSIREKEVLQRNFGLDEYEPHTLEDIARLMHISRERVRQIRESALKHIRSHLEKPLPKRKKLRIFDMK